MGAGYVFFEILRPEDLSYTYKLNPAAFSVPWNMTTSTATLVLADPPCGCGALKNYEDIEGNIALIERGDCSFTSKGVCHAYNSVPMYLFSASKTKSLTHSLLKKMLITFRKNYFWIYLRVKLFLLSET